MSFSEEPQTEASLHGARVAFAGKLGGMTKREAQRLVRDRGGTPVDQTRPDLDLIVIGADQLPLEEASLLDENTRQAAAAGKLEIIGETEFWQRMGLFGEVADTKLYTPGMLAELLRVPIRVIRRWHRRRLIIPVREVRRLPYFDFQEVATARQLARLIAAGVSVAAVEKKLEELSRLVPDVERPLAQLSIIVEGRQLLLRQGEGLVEPGGQLRIDFEALDMDSADSAEGCPAVTLPYERPIEPESLDPDKLVALAADLEDEGLLDNAADYYRAAMAAGGPRPDICFQLAETLYRMGELTAAGERYYMAVELDEDFVEARANLGCLLAETGQLELAVAAFEGALSYHRDYPDVHYHLARTLDELRRRDEAEEHWKQFLMLAPDSPWSEEARQRLF